MYGVLFMATMNISLPHRMKAWVESRLDRAEFSNTSDYVRHLIRRDQERQEAIAAFQRAVDAGTQSGEPEEFDFKAFKASMHDRYGRK